jgi:hypothetical protein
MDIGLARTDRAKSTAGDAFSTRVHIPLTLQNLMDNIRFFFSSWPLFWSPTKQAKVPSNHIKASVEVAVAKCNQLGGLVLQSIFREGLFPNPESRELVRRREARPVGANPVDVA